MRGKMHISDAADYLGVKPGTLRQMIHVSKVPAWALEKDRAGHNWFSRKWLRAELHERKRLCRKIT